LPQNILGIFLLFLPVAAFAQQPEPISLKSDTPRVKQHIAKAKKIAGAQWATAEHYFCEAPRTDAPNDPVIEPAKIFDNVYAIGNSGTTAYIIGTSGGLVMIDALRPNQLDTQLFPGFQKLGLDPAKVKAILITHGHADHFGGAAYFQEHYGSHVYIAQADWDLMERPRARAGGPAAPAATIPKRDMVIVEGQPIAIGDENIMPYAAGPHTPGSMAFIFPVKDNALFGSVLLVTTGTTDEGMQEHLKIIARFKDAAKRAKVYVELQNHPLMDDFTDKLAMLKERKPGQPNPFIVGQAGYMRFLDVMSECMQAEVDRRANR
jgi:metallo-beta-lactamase class B